jgi:hypothetical protein
MEYFFIIQVIKSRKLICAEHVARTVGKRNTCKISGEKPDEETVGNNRAEMRRKRLSGPYSNKMKRRGLDRSGPINAENFLTSC